MPSVPKPSQVDKKPKSLSQSKAAVAARARRAKSKSNGNAVPEKPASVTGNGEAMCKAGEVAAMLGVSVHRVYALIATGKLQATVTDTGRKQVLRSSADAYAATRQPQAGESA